MIRINLLPHEAGGKAPKAASGPQAGAALVALILIVAYVAVAGLFAFFYNQKYQTDQRLAELQARETELADRKDNLEEEYQELRQMLEVLRNQDAVLSVLDPEDRLFWAEKLNILPLYVPEGVYLTQIQVTEDVREVETQESIQAYNEWERQRGDKGEPPERIMMPIITQTLTLDGVAYVPDGTSDQRLGLITQFFTALDQKDVQVPFSGETVTFMDNMRRGIDYDEFQQDEISGREVTRFTFVIQSRQSSPQQALNQQQQNQGRRRGG